MAAIKSMMKNFNTVNLKKKPANHRKDTTSLADGEIEEEEVSNISYTNDMVEGQKRDKKEFLPENVTEGSVGGNEEMFDGAGDDFAGGNNWQAADEEEIEHAESSGSDPEDDENDEEDERANSYHPVCAEDSGSDTVSAIRAYVLRQLMDKERSLLIHLISVCFALLLLILKCAPISIGSVFAYAMIVLLVILMAVVCPRLIGYAASIAVKNALRAKLANPRKTGQGSSVSDAASRNVLIVQTMFIGGMDLDVSEMDGHGLPFHAAVGSDEKKGNDKEAAAGASAGAGDGDGKDKLRVDLDCFILRRIHFHCGHLAARGDAGTTEPISGACNEEVAECEQYGNVEEDSAADPSGANGNDIGAGAKKTRKPDILQKFSRAVRQGAKKMGKDIDRDFKKIGKDLNKLKQTLLDSIENRPRFGGASVVRVRMLMLARDKLTIRNKKSKHQPVPLKKLGEIIVKNLILEVVKRPHNRAMLMQLLAFDSSKMFMTHMKLSTDRVVSMVKKVTRPIGKNKK